MFNLFEGWAGGVSKNNLFLSPCIWGRKLDDYVRTDFGGGLSTNCPVLRPYLWAGLGDPSRTYPNSFLGNTHDVLFGQLVVLPIYIVVWDKSDDVEALPLTGVTTPPLLYNIYIITTILRSLPMVRRCTDRGCFPTLLSIGCSSCECLYYTIIVHSRTPSMTSSDYSTETR